MPKFMRKFTKKTSERLCPPCPRCPFFKSRRLWL